MKLEIFDTLQGTYHYTPKARVAACCVLVVQILTISNFYFKDGKKGMPLEEWLYIGVIVLAGAYIAFGKILRMVVVGPDYVVAHSLFGLFCQRVELEKVDSVQFGGFRRGVRIDLTIEGKLVRFAGNEDFLWALHARMRQQYITKEGPKQTHE